MPKKGGLGVGRWVEFNKKKKKSLVVQVLSLSCIYSVDIFSKKTNAWINVHMGRSELYPGHL